MSWILLRGLTREARHWGTFTARLSQQCGTEKVIALDLPGSGEFFLHTSPVEMHSVVEFLRLQLRAKDLPPPHKLLAMSLGGMVATSWAQRHPQEITQLVLINSSMRPFSHALQRLRPTRWLQVALLAARWNDADYAEHMVHRLTCHQVHTRDIDVTQWRHIRQTAPVTATNAARQLLAAARFKCAPEKPACGVLVLSSDADRLVHPQCSVQLAGAWRARHHQHTWAGHDLPHDDPTWICQKIADWQSDDATLVQSVQTNKLLFQ